MTGSDGNDDVADPGAPRPSDGVGFDVALALALLAVFSPALLSMSEVWAVVDYQAHGYLVGPVVLAMAWSRRDELARAGRQPMASGLPWMIAALVAYAVGLLADLIALQGASFPLALAGLVAWRRGRRALGVLAFPLVYLLFMVPVPPQWLAPLVTRLQSFVTAAAITILHGLEVPAMREGNVLILPEGSLFVAEACSGITSIVTLLPVAALLVFLMRASVRQGSWLLLSVVPVAMVWNLVRVLVTVAATRSVGAVRATTGSLHDTAGMLTFVMGCLTLLAVSAWLARSPEPPRANPAGA